MSTDFVKEPGKALEKFLLRPSRRVHAGAVLGLITSQYTSGAIARLRKDAARGDVKAVRGLVEELRKKAVEEEEFTASIIPTVVSAEKARSMKMLSGEKPSTETVNFWLYLQVSGVLIGNSIVNLLNVDEEAHLDFLDRLMDEGVLVKGKARFNPKELIKVLGNNFPLDLEFCAAFAYINYFAYWVKKHIGQPEQRPDIFGLPGYVFKNYGLTEKTTLVVIKVPSRGGGEAKRGLHFIPRVSSFLTRWYGDYWSSQETYPPIGRFISSLYEPGQKESKYILNSFLRDLLNDRVNGLLLARLATIRADNVLTPKAKKTKGIFEVKQFLRGV